MKKTVQLFKALSDETRLRILALLRDGELCVCDLMAVLELPQSTVSRHLATLRNAGLVEDRRQGVWMLYRLAGGGPADTTELLALVERISAQSLPVQRDRLALSRRVAALKQGDCR